MAGRLEGTIAGRGAMGVGLVELGSCWLHTAVVNMAAVRRVDVRFHGIGMPPGEAPYFKLTLLREGRRNPRRMWDAKE
jgi:hypothetical protein